MGFGKDGKGAIIREKTTLTLGALAAQDAVQVDSAVLLDQDFRVLKTELTAVIRALTSAEGAGLTLHMVQGILTAAEAEAALEQNAPIRMGERVQMEAAERWVRRVGITKDGQAQTAVAVFTNAEGGGLLALNPRWTFRRGRTAAEGGWNWMVYNHGVTLTTGASVDIMATHYGVWVS